MRRAVFVGAGTVAGLVAALSYTPGVPAGLSAHWPRSAAAHRHHSNDTGDSSRARDRSSSQRRVTAERPRKSRTSAQSTTVRDAATSSSGEARGSTPHSQQQTTPAVSHQPTVDATGSKPTKNPKPDPAPKPTPEPRPASFTGSVASTPFGPVQVEVTVLDGRITDVTAVQYPQADPQSRTIADKALPKLRAETLQAQSASIASVSGATYTSGGWITSLQSALVKAGW